MHVTNAHNLTAVSTTICTRTLQSRCSELQDIRRIGEPSALLQSDVLSLNDEERKSLLKEVGIADEIKMRY